MNGDLRRHPRAPIHLQPSFPSSLSSPASHSSPETCTQSQAAPQASSDQSPRASPRQSWISFSFLKTYLHFCLCIVVLDVRLPAGLSVLKCLCLRLVETVAHQGTGLHFNMCPSEVGDFHQIVMPMSKIPYFMDSDLGEHGLSYILLKSPPNRQLHLSVEFLLVWVK